MANTSRKKIRFYDFNGQTSQQMAWVQRVGGKQIYNNPSTKSIFEPNNSSMKNSNNRLIER